MIDKTVIEDTNILSNIRATVDELVQEVLTDLAESEEMIELPMAVQFDDDLVLERQTGKAIATTVLKGITDKQILIAVSQSTRGEPIEVGYLEPPTKDGKFISAIISPDYANRLPSPKMAIKNAMIQLHTLDLVSAAMGIKLISHGIDVNRIVYSINLG